MKIGIDIRTEQAKKRIMCRLARLKTTVQVQDCGEYWFGGCTDWHKIIVETTRSEAEVDNWFYKLRLPNTNWAYGTFIAE